MRRTYANYRKDNWDEHLVDVEMACNSAINSITLCSPFYLKYVMTPRKKPLEAPATTIVPKRDSWKNESYNIAGKVKRYVT